jgi:hypothetical protein
MDIIMWLVLVGALLWFAWRLLCASRWLWRRFRLHLPQFRLRR